MLLTISTTRQPATDLGFLLAKHPDKIQTYEVPGGQAHVFYPESNVARCTAALLLDLDPVTLTRQAGERVNEFALQPYVNDRPYVASSWLTTALTKVFGSALNGKCREFPDLPNEAWPFEVTLSAVPGSDESIQRLFGPLGYEIEATRGSLDEQFPEWGQSRYVALTLRNTCRLADLLSQLYVLIPVLDADKHYYLSEDEAEKLLAKGGGWLDQHPEKGFIVRRYLQRSSLVKNFNTRSEAATEAPQEPALATEPAVETDDFASAVAEPKVSEREFRLHAVRLRTAYEQVKAAGAKTVLDLGCGEGKLLKLLLDDRQFTRILGMDVSLYALDIAKRRLKLDRLSDHDRDRLTLLQGSATYRDRRMEGFDAVLLVEVMEHLELHRLPALERVVFEHARPGMVVVTTPRADYNEKFAEQTAAGQFRHDDHRFEWTEAEFQTWATQVAAQHGYQVTFQSIGEAHEQFGALANGCF